MVSPAAVVAMPGATSAARPTRPTIAAASGPRAGPAPRGFVPASVGSGGGRGAGTGSVGRSRTQQLMRKARVPRAKETTRVKR